MNISTGPGSPGTVLEDADSWACAVQGRLQESYGWSAARSEEFCFDFASNYQRIAYMCHVLGFSPEEIAEKVNREAVTAGYARR